MPNINRRRFLAGAASLSALPFVSFYSNASFAKGGDLSAGIQLWSIRNAVNENPTNAIEKIASFGFKKVETAGFGGLSAKNFRELLDANGLICTGAHESFQGSSIADSNWQQIFDNTNDVGARLVGSGMLMRGTGANPLPAGTEGREGYEWMRLFTIDDAKKAADLSNKIGEKAKANGLKYYYHNHPFEFAEVSPGITAYDIMLAETDPDLVDFQLDCGWAEVGGQDSVSYMKKYGNRFSSLHIKNFLPLSSDMVSGFQRKSTELANGTIDYKPILKAALDIGIQHIYVEQEDPFINLKPLAAAKANFETLEKLKNSID